MDEAGLLERLVKEDRALQVLSCALAVLEWDLETGMPSGATEGRIGQMSALSLLMHERTTSPEFVELVSSLDENDGFSPWANALIRNHKKNVERELRIPSSLVLRRSEVCGRAHDKWMEARRSSDFSIFASSLEDVVSVEKEIACACDSSKRPYDVLLDSYEPDIGIDVLDPLFDRMEKDIHLLMDEVVPESIPVDDSFLFKGYDRTGLEAFCREVSFAMGFDPDRGAFGISAHPFTTTLGPDDVRITNRFTDAGLFDPVGSQIHETGHALYEQRSSLNPDIRGTSLSGGVSMGIHESQSRFWENFLGRSLEFWKYWYPRLVSHVPSLSEVTLIDFHRAVNKARPSAIRVNADELTYSLHIILRYRIEKMLMDGSLPVSSVPEAWNVMSRDIIRYVPESDAEGCLQDSHWSGCLFGYFPSYALGNIYAAQFHERMVADLGGESELGAMLEKCDYGAILSWLDRNIWQKGGIYLPKDLLLQVTGSALDAGPYVDYLARKFKSLF